MSFLSDFSKYLAGALNHCGKEDFSSYLANLFKHIVPTDNIMIIVYPSRKLPRIDYNDLPANNQRSMAGHFLSGAFLLDPCYLAVTQEKKSGFYHLPKIAPSGFQESEYYKTYFTQAGLIDECGYLIHLDEEGRKFVNISLGQTQKASHFSDKDLVRLEEVFPMIEALTKCHWTPLEVEQEVSYDLRAQLEMALASFGTSVLTDREGQIVKLILQGYSNKAIAERFSISIETVKLHRKNAYAKLDLSTQGEIFNLFINSLMHIENYDGGDPLINYLSTCSQPS